MTEKKVLHTASALDPRFKGLPFLTEEDRLDVYTGVISEAASLEVIQFDILKLIYRNIHNNVDVDA